MHRILRLELQHTFHRNWDRCLIKYWNKYILGTISCCIIYNIYSLLLALPYDTGDP